MSNEFDSIRPYNDDEVKQAVNDLLNDRQFNALMKGLMPWLPKGLRNGIIRIGFIGVNSVLGFQKRFMNPVVGYIFRKCSTGHTFDCSNVEKGAARYSYISNHRDIVLDSAMLSYQLIENGFEETVEIGIGDNLLIYSWIRTLARLNRTFIVRRGLSPRELLASSQLMSRYIHYALTEKHANMWLAQREGRAKDSSDHTQEAVLKMLAMGKEGSPIDSLRELNIVPLTISYEYDPCDYLKAKEFQLKRDDPRWKKSKQDDLENMKVGILGKKGHVHYEMAEPINTWIDELADEPRTTVFKSVAERMDRAIHSHYRLYPGNYVAADLLAGDTAHAAHYTDKDKQTFEQYLQSRIDLIDLENKDVAFLRQCILTMYANPVLNKEKSEA
ncbi:MAG: acyltransferase [Bacteroidaceae bacterium]|nr:acyltransferase [Bacteroidaceae bacterium]